MFVIGTGIIVQLNIQWLTVNHKVSQTAIVPILDIVGGLNSWKENVLFPKAPTNGSKDELAQFEKMKEVAKYFGGQAQNDSSVTDSKPEIKLPTSKTSNVKTTKPTGKKKKREGC